LSDACSRQTGEDCEDHWRHLLIYAEDLWLWVVGTIQYGNVICLFYLYITSINVLLQKHARTLTH